MMRKVNLNGFSIITYKLIRGGSFRLLCKYLSRILLQKNPTRYRVNNAVPAANTTTQLDTDYSTNLLIKLESFTRKA